MKKAFISAFVWGVIFNVSWAQEQRLMSSEQAESEVSAVINPANDQEMIVAAINDFSTTQGRNQTRLSVFYTQNGGQSWQESNYTGKLNEGTPQTLIIGDPVLAFDGKGTGYLSHIVWEGNTNELNTQLYVAQTLDGGKTWTPQILQSGVQTVDYD